VSSTFETRAARRRSWVVAASAAFLGWLFAVLLLTLGLRPLGLVLCVAGVCALTVATVYGLVRKLRAVELLGYAFACIMLEWPILVFPTLLILTWAHVAKWE
jgi:hypothetical protein